MSSEIEAIVSDYVASKPIGSLIVKYLVYLKKMQLFNPKVIYDIGSSLGKFAEAAKLVFPDAEIYLFDACPSFEPYYQNNKYFITCLSDEDDKEVKFYDTNTINDPRVKSYYKSKYSTDEYKVCKTSKLDSFIKANNLPPPDLVKISCGGSEMDIINGGLDTLKNSKYVMVQLQNEEIYEGAPLAHRVGPYIESFNFERKDTLDSYGIALIDYVFENKNI